MNKVKEIIENFEKQIQVWSENVKYQGIDFIYNNDLNYFKENKNDIKYILVGDNPGNIEADKKRYLVGPAGISARIFFERYLVDNFNKEVLVLNKTPIYTNVTDGLEEIKTDDIIKETQIFMVEMIRTLYCKLKVPIIITGYSNGIIKRKGVFKINNKSLHYFFSEFVSIFDKNDDFFIIPHFSRGMFFNAIDIDKLENIKEEVLFNLGKENKDMFVKGVML